MIKYIYIYTLLITLLTINSSYAKLIGTTYNPQDLSDVNYIYQDKNGNIEVYNPNTMSTTYINNE